MAYQQIVSSGFEGADDRCLGKVPGAYAPNFDNSQEFVDDHARRRVFPFEKGLAATVEAAKDLVVDTKLKDMKSGQSMVWGACLMTRGEDRKFYMSGFDLLGGNIPTPTTDGVVKDCSVFGSRKNAATSVRILQEFDDGFVLSYYDVTVPFQSYKLFEVEPKVGDGLGHSKYGHSHALRFIMSNQREHTVELDGEMITVVCQEVDPGLYVVPHVLMLDRKYRVAFNPDNVAKDYDDSVEVEVIGFSLNWSVFWAHCHIAILMKVEDKYGFEIKTPLTEYLLGIPVKKLEAEHQPGVSMLQTAIELTLKDVEPDPEPEPEPEPDPEPEPEPESLCSMMTGGLCRGTSVASSDDGLEAPLARTMTSNVV